MLRSCPGTGAIKEIRPEDIPCPHCHAQVEIWSDEYRARCTGCNAWVYRQQGALCLDWCARAQECVGTTAYAAFKRAREREAGTIDGTNTAAI